MTPAPTLALTRRTDVLVGVGVALMSAAIALSTFYSRRDNDLDWSSFGVGVAATGVLLVLAVVGLLGFADHDLNAALSSWPLALGALGTGLMVTVAMDFDEATPWVAGIVVTAVGAAGYAAVRRPAPALAAIVGLAVLYVKVLDATISDVGDDGLIFIGAAVLAFTFGATVAAWFLRGRDVVAITVGAAAVLVYASTLSSFSFLFFLGGYGTETTTLDYDDYDPLASLHDDIYWLLLYGLALVLMWAALSLLTGHPGYRVLIVALVTIQVPISVAVLAVEHPDLVGLTLVVVAALLLAVAVVRSLNARDDAASVVTGDDVPPPYTP